MFFHVNNNSQLSRTIWVNPFLSAIPGKGTKTHSKKNPMFLRNRGHKTSVILEISQQALKCLLQLSSWTVFPHWSSGYERNIHIKQLTLESWTIKRKRDITYWLDFTINRFTVMQKKWRQSSRLHQKCFFLSLEVSSNEFGAVPYYICLMGIHTASKDIRDWELLQWHYLTSYPRALILPSWRLGFLKTQSERILTFEQDGD